MKRTIIAALSTLATTTLVFAVTAHSASLVDCPLRDEAYSVDTPLLDILLKHEAKTILERHLPGMIDRMPSQMASTEVPSFAAIMSPRTAAGMVQLPAENIDALDEALGKLEVTDSDRQARCARYDVDVPDLDHSEGELSVLVFEKINGFHHGDAVTAATDALKAMAERNDWGIAVTDRGGAMTPELLNRFDVVIWNNVSGDVLTLTQRQVFQDYLEAGGGYVGIHGSAGDSLYLWDWYADTLLGARFQGHPMEPQFQEGRIDVEDLEHIGRGLPAHWTMKEEWYSFHNNPRASGAYVVATLDESTYAPEGYGGQDLRMGGDHPLVWANCVGNGRSFYSAIGHLPDSYEEPHHVKLLEQGISWAAGEGEALCHSP